MKIPKLIHMVWVGCKRPEKYQFLFDGIKNINYDYEIIEWNDDNINFELINEDLYRSCTNVGAKSDILRFEILHKFGGIYIDYDFLQIKKFDDLLDCEFFAGNNNINSNEIWNSIVGSMPNNDITRAFLNGLKNNLPIRPKENERVMNETGPYYLQKIIQSNNFDKKPDVKILKGEYFFPFPGGERHKVRNLSSHEIEYAKSFATEKTYCIHLHTTAWQ